MRFNLQGTDYDTTNMTQFETGQPCLPKIYVNTDGLIFLETHRDGWLEPRMRRIPRFEALRIAALYHVDNLRHFLLTEKPAPQTCPRPTETERELIAKLHDLTPDQLDRLANFLQTARN